MVDHDALHAAFQDYAKALLEPFDVGTVLYRLVDQASSVLGLDGAGVSVAHRGEHLVFVAATGGAVSAVEGAQAEHGEGPCQDAFRTGVQITVPDLADEDRWPRYTEVAAASGIRSVAALPMPVGEHRIGALNCYRREPHDWSAQQLRTGQLLADMASGYILSNQAMHESRTLADQLQRALDSRIVIEQAKGVLAERHGIDPDAAFERLRSRSRSTHMRIHELARKIVEGTTDL